MKIIEGNEYPHLDKGQLQLSTFWTCETCPNLVTVNTLTVLGGDKSTVKSDDLYRLAIHLNLKPSSEASATEGGGCVCLECYSKLDEGKP